MRAWLMVGVAACNSATDGLDPSGRNDGLGITEPEPTGSDPKTTPKPTPDPKTTPKPKPKPEPKLPNCDEGGSAEAAKACTVFGRAVVEGKVYEDLQEAIDVAPEGGTVWLCPSTARGEFEIEDRNLRLEAAEPGQGRLDGNNLERILEIIGGTVVLRGFELRRGFSEDSGAALRVRNTDLTLQCMTVRDSQTEGSGGALSVSNSTLLVEDTEFVNNLGTSGGAVRVNSTVGTGARFVRSAFDRNRATDGGGGLGVGSNGTAIVTLEDTTFEDNEAGLRGGAVALFGEQGPTLTVTRGVFDENFATQSGGAVSIFTRGLVDVSFLGTRFEDNEATWGAAVGVTSAPLGGSVSFVDAALTDNQAQSQNGAIQTEAPQVLVSCTNCDLGEGALDNVPHDVVVGGTVLDGDDEVDFVLPKSATP